VLSVAYSPNGQYIISGSSDKTIQIWDAKTSATIGWPLEGHTESVQSVAYCPDGQHIASVSSDHSIHVLDESPHRSVQPPSSNPIQPPFHAQPDPKGWVRDLEGGLLYWVPPDCRVGLHSPALLAIPLTSSIRQVSLDFEDFVFGTSWTQIFNSAQL
jgi:WD40 repeat protein